MSKSLLSLFVAVLLVVGFAVVNTMAAPGEKAVFESPMVPTGTDGCTESPAGECSESEGKIERNGDWKVEINGVPASTPYDICIEDDYAGETKIGDTTSNSDGELKATEASGDEVQNDTYVNPRLVVRDDDVTDCAGTEQFTTGFSDGE